MEVAGSMPAVATYSFGLLAQLVERRPVKAKVLGSNPRKSAMVKRFVMHCKTLWQINYLAESKRYCGNGRIRRRVNAPLNGQLSVNVKALLGKLSATQLCSWCNGFLVPVAPRIGALVELVNMLPCHGKGHGFESRRFRKHILVHGDKQTPNL